MLGDNIRKFRTRNGLSQQELSEKLNVSRPTISSWELNRTEPTMGNIEQLAKIFNCKKSDLISDDPIDEMHFKMAEESKKEILINDLTYIARESELEDIKQAIKFLEFMKFRPFIDSILSMKSKKQEEPQ